MRLLQEHVKVHCFVVLVSPRWHFELVLGLVLIWLDYDTKIINIMFISRWHIHYDVQFYQMKLWAGFEVGYKGGSGNLKSL